MPTCDRLPYKYIGINNFRKFGPPNSTPISTTQIDSKITQIDTFLDSKLPIFRVKLPISGNVHIFSGIFFGFDPATLRSATFGYFFGYFCPKAPKSTVELWGKKVPKSTLFSTLEKYSSLLPSAVPVYARCDWLKFHSVTASRSTTSTFQ